ncbi:nitroreductase family protein [Actinoplanes sp. NPDC049265]|uniref:nitroreductase family protein n=1 Tax=Actinoplanes sp. NPDC049265 TaxID=3363902 RepID=UPI00371B4A13
MRDIDRRRDVRGEFTGEQLPDVILDRIVTAAHAALSVGLPQPWDLVVVRDTAFRTTFHEHVHRARRRRDESRPACRTRGYKSAALGKD